MKGKKLNLIIIFLSFGVLLYFIFKEDSISNLIKIIKSANIFWMLCAVLLMAIYWILEACNLHIVVKKFEPKHKFNISFEASVIGQYFNCITPFSSGGQPMQAYYMVKKGVSLGDASCSLLIKFIVYQFVLTIYSAISLMFYFKDLFSKVNGINILVLFGFGINTVVIIGLLSICFFKNGVQNFIKNATHFFYKMHFVKDEGKTLTHLIDETENFYNGFQIIKKNINMIFIMAFLSAIQLTCFFLIPYFIHLALNLGHASLLAMISAQAFVLNFSSFIPLPGASGGAEWSFHQILGNFFTASLIGVTILIWRIITFYLPMIIGMTFFIYITKSKKKSLC